VIVGKHPSSKRNFPRKKPNGKFLKYPATKLPPFDITQLEMPTVRFIPLRALLEFMSGLDGQFASRASFSLSYSFSYGDNIGSTYEINNEDTTSSGTNPDTGSDGKHETTNAADGDDGEDHSTPVNENQENHDNVQDESVSPLEAQNIGRALSSGGLIALLTCIVAALVGVMFIITYRKLNWMQSGESSTPVSEAESSLSSAVV
jgi:hypothetical protein